jgi:CRISPR/Cas system-associated protein Cas7 (RAMP superfamily)
LLSPQSTTTNEEGTTAASLSSSSSITTSFHHAIERIQHFQHTSDRLASLLSHILYTIEEEMDCDNDDVDEDDEEECNDNDERFRKVLALKAMKQQLHFFFTK